MSQERWTQVDDYASALLAPHTVFVPFAILFLKERMRLDFLWAALCMMGAVYFVFRGAAHQP